MKALPAGALVVLTHGLWMSRQALFVWRRQFARRGVDAVAFGYPSREPLADNAKRLSAFIGAFARMGVAERKGALAELKGMLPAGFELVMPR